MGARTEQFQIKVVHALVLAIALLLVPPALAQGTSEVLVSETVNAYNPIPSPDGKLIAYGRTGWGRPGGSGGFGRSNLQSGIAVISGTGTPLSQSAVADAFLFGWTPDGTKLICYRDGHFYLVLSNGGIVEEKEEAGGDSAFSRSERVAYLSKSHSFVWVEHNRSAMSVLLTRNGTLAENSAMTGAIVVPSPDERYIAVAGNGMDLWVYDTAQKKWANLGQVTIHPDTDWDYIKPSWNPWFADSSRLAFFSGPSLVIASADGKQRQVIVTSTDAAGLAVPSADGSRVAYVTFVPRPMKVRPDLKFWGSSTIWTVPVTGGKPQRITTTSDDTTYDLKWMDKTKLVFDRLADERFYSHVRLWMVDVP